MIPSSVSRRKSALIPVDTGRCGSLVVILPRKLGIVLKASRQVL